MPEIISQFCALMYKNTKRYQYSIVLTLIEIGLTLIIGKLMSLGISKIDTTAPSVNDIESLIKSEMIYMPNTNNFKEFFNKGQSSSSNKAPVNAIPVDSLSQMEKSYNIWGNVQTWKQEKHVIKFEQAESSADKVPAKLDFQVVLFEPVPASKTLNLNFDYTQAGLTSAQLLVTKSYLNYWKQERHMSYNTDFSIKTQKIPDTVMDVCEKNLIYLPAIFVVFTIFSTIYIAEEKTTNIKDTLKNMGMSQLIYWISWFFDRMVIGLVLSSSVVAHWLSTLDSGFVQHVSKTYFIIWFLLMVINNLTLAFVLACLLPGKFIVPLTMVTYGMLNALSYTLISVKVTFIKIMAGLLLFSHGNRICVGAIFSKEISYGNVKDSANADKQFLEGALYIVLNSVFNCLIVFAMETISNMKKYRTSTENMEESKSQSQNEKLFEAVAGGQKAEIVIQDLVKMYGKDTVVSGINLDIYKDQITMLLGHTGAGKTTVLSMVVGATSITSGKVTIDGTNIKTAGLRRTLGYCPETDTLFPRLSPYDHLVFFSLLRNNSIKEADALEMLTQLGLADKANVCSQVLSCGQKRKISIACAFVGNTKTIILDEPSTGLDPCSRQDLWRALKSWRPGRTIFMTTHFMDEAENLSDRIVIMDKGRIKCCGTPMFLKKICGLEHRLTIVKGDNCKDHKVVKYVMSSIRKAIFQTSNNSEISFSLPGNCGTEIPKLLQGLEENKETLNITSYTVASTSVEDVFTRLDESEIKSPTKTPPDSPHFMDTFKGADFSSSTDVLNTNQPSPEVIEIAVSQAHQITGHPLRVQQLCALMRKRWILFQRNLLPVLLFILASIILLVLCILNSNQSQLSKSMYFKAQDYNDIIVVMGKPLEPEAQQIYNSVKELLPPDFQVIEPDPASTYYDYMKDWGRVNSVEKYRDNLMMGFEIKQPPESSIVYYRSSFVHSQAVAVNLLLNAHVRTYLGATHSIQSGVYPHDAYRNDYKTQLWMMRLIHLSLIGFQLLIMSWHLYERISGAQQLQSISGCHYCMFWFANYLFDLAVLLVCSTLLWVYVCALNVLAFDYQHVLLLMFMQFILFLAILPLLYLFQYLFHKASTASFLFVIIMTAYAILLNRNVLRTYLTISPNVLFFEFYSSILGTAKLEGDSLGLLSGTYLWKSFSTSLLFWLWLLVIVEWDHTTGHKSSNLYEERKKKETNKVTSEIALEGDDEVISEKNRILNSNIKDLFHTDELLLVKVSMRYFNCMALHLAVDQVSFGVAKSECFGLLGENGAGRSTMFRLLLCDLTFCGGDIYYSGLNLYKQKIKIYQKIGYCPQQDGFHGDLTGRESLQLYGRLKGIPKENLQEVIDGLLKQVMLEVHADKLAKYYSSGDKRKLSIAIAMIGKPQFLLLDQPTSGMDIICKKAIWSVVQNLKTQGTTIVLSSDSMEECEALCTRLTIMAQGKLLCLGTPQHLKTKYAQGFTITVYLKPQPEHAMDEVIQYLKELFDQIEIFNQLDTYLHLQVPAEMFPLSVLFDKMETAKKDLDLEHYSIQQTSLEQVFLMFMNKIKKPNKTEQAGSKLSDVHEQNDKNSTVL